MTGEEGGWRDVVVLGDCEETVVRVCELCGWEGELGRMVAGGRGVRAASHTNKSSNKHDHTHKCIQHDCA